MTGALPWFAEALRLDRDEPGAAATHRLRLGTILNQCPVIDQIFTHEKTILWAAARSRGPAARHRLGRPHRPDLGRGDAAQPSLRRWLTTDRSTGSNFRATDSRLLSASDDGTIRIWNAADGKPSGGRWLTHASPVRLARFSPDGKRIVSAGFNRTRLALGRRAGHVRRPDPAVERGRSFAWPISPDGTMVAIGASDCYASLWKVSDQGLRFVSRLLHKAPVGDVCFSPDGSRLLIASHDGTARVWDIKNENERSRPR